MKHKVLLLVLLCAFFTPAEPQALEGVKAAEGLKPPAVLTPEFLREACYNYGAVNTVRMLTTGPESGLWNELLRHIADGETGWIIYVPLFISGTEAGQATQLSIALAEALPKNPHAVLSLEYSFVSLRRVCSLPFIDPDKEFIRRYLQDVSKAMQDISDPYMKSDKDICLGRLKASVVAAHKRLDAAAQASAK